MDEKFDPELFILSMDPLKDRCIPKVISKENAEALLHYITQHQYSSLRGFINGGIFFNVGAHILEIYRVKEPEGSCAVYLHTRS
jgi:hypothetical protein